MKNILTMGVASQKTNAIIKNIELISVLRAESKLQQKIVLHVVDETTQLEYRVSDAWIDYKDEPMVRALWFLETPDGIYAESTLAKAMLFYNVKNLKDLVGQTVKLFPDKNKYLTLVITDKL
jgi:hypothetical protein